MDTTRGEAFQVRSITERRPFVRSFAARNSSTRNGSNQIHD